jgi:hypothetical protein
LEVLLTWKSTLNMILKSIKMLLIK